VSLVFIVGIQPNGQRVWFSGLKEGLDQYKRPTQAATWDDASGRQVDLAFAIDARERWRSQGLNIQITVEKYGPPIDEDRGTAAPQQDLRQPQFVPFTNGLGLIVSPGNTPKGQAWFVKASEIPAFKIDGRHTAIESVSGATPIEAAQRAVDSWGQEILFRDPAQDERDEKARQQAQVAQQRNQTPRNIRPGDRS